MMESNACDTDNLPNESDNTNLNEATPATAPLVASDAPKDANCLSANAEEGDDAISSTTPDKFVEELDPSTSNMIALEPSLNVETDADFFAAELSITDVPTEKITENVEDIVQDLENLLGESNDSYRFGRESFDNSKLTESFDEVNSSNVEDLVQQSVLHQFEEANMDLDTPVLKDDVLPGDGILPADIISSDLSIPLEMPGTTTSEVSVSADVINELKDITETETAVLDLVESTAESAVDITLELKDIIPEVVPLEIVEQGGLAIDTDVNVSTYDTALTKDADPCTNSIFGDVVEKSEAGCSSNVEQISEVEAQIETSDDKVCEMDVAQEDSVTSINIPDSNEISLNLEDLPVQINLDQNLTALEQPLENPAELLDELVESANIPDDSSTCVEDLLDSGKDLSNNLDSEIVTPSIVEDKAKLQAALPEVTQSVEDDQIRNISSEVTQSVQDDQIRNISPEVTQSVEDDQIRNISPEVTQSVENDQIRNTSSEVTPSVEQDQPTLPEISEPSIEDVTSVEEIKGAEDLAALPEMVKAEDEEQKDQKQEVQLKLQEVQLKLPEGNEQAGKNESESEQPKEQEILSEMEQSEDVDEVAALPEIVKKSNLICEDVSMNMDDNASADVLPIQADEEPEELKTTELVQPLTVEVEDPAFNESAVTAVATEVQKANKVEEVEPMEVAEVVEADIPTNKAQAEGDNENHINRAPLKMTIAKHKSENVHSILKIYDPNEVHPSDEQHIPKLVIKSTPSSTTDPEESTTPEEPVIPKITIKPVLTPPESQHSPKLTIKPIKLPAKQDVDTPRSKSTSGTGSPRITIKPVIKPETLSPLKVTLRPYPRCEDMPSSPKLNIKPIVKPSEDESHHSPKITIKPIIKPPDDVPTHAEERHSPRITIKPIIKPTEEFTKSDESVQSPRITIKPIIKQEREESDDSQSPPMQQPFKLNIKPVVRPAESSLSPKITIKPIVKPPEVKSEPVELIDFEEQIKQERIVLKIAKNTKKASSENEKLKKIKVKLSKEGGTAHIVSAASLKRSASDDIEHESKYFKAESTSDLTISLVSNTTSTTTLPDVTITRVDNSSIKTEFKQEDSSSNDTNAAVSIESLPSNVSSSVSMEELPDPLADIPVFEITLETAAAMNTASKATAAAASGAAAPPAPRKRGRPRKVPLEVREDFKDPKEEEPVPVRESTRPKRSCRGTSARATLGIKPRKPRAPRGGGKRTVSTRATSARKSKEDRKSPAAKTKPPKESMIKESDLKEFEPKDAEFKQVPLPAVETANTEVVMYEEETRMSAENSSRAQTPAKQVLVSSTEVIEESQSSIQSNTTTESGEKLQKVRKGPRLEVHQEPEGEVISADKLTEYSWGGGGPYMLQEQVAQFLGIKSFKRKYPGIQRRTVDMQERDFIRESCLASEAMCDMGLTAVRTEDILDIMYTDFQNKYEEYCKHLRDRQAKDVSNKQKALSLAASQEKTKMDIVEQAVQSAFQWNASFNKARREQRRACMDLQSFTVHFPRGKMKQVNKPPIGNYPLALVPGQFTDYYKKYSPYELSNLPLNTIGCKSISINHDTEESQSDASGSDSDSSSSDSDSSCSGSSGAEDCKMCRPAASKKLLVH